MSAYNRDGLSIEAYLVRIIAALCRQAGGELRVKGELVDTVGEATALLKAWDSTKQELVLTTAMGSFGEVFRVVPEKQTGKQPVPVTAPPEGRTADPLERLFTPQTPAEDGKRSVNTLEDTDRLVDIESKLRKLRIARMFADEMAARKRAPQA